jgi:hypothetical protein
MDGRTAYPNRKISETCLEFAAPMLEDLSCLLALERCSIFSKSSEA